MKPTEIARIQAYLRKTFDNNRITVPTPPNENAPVEAYIGDEFFGVVYKDEDEGEVSYSLIISILEMDLPNIAEVL